MGGVITWLSTWLMQWQQSRAGDQQTRNGAAVEALAAAVGFSTAVQAYRVAWVDHTLLARLRTPDKRAIVTDFMNMLMPHMGPLVHKLTEISLWKVRKHGPIVSAARQFSDAVGQLAESMAGKDDVYKASCAEYEEALAGFRAAAAKYGT